MLLELALWLEQYSSFFGVFEYITLRAILSALTALAVLLLMGPSVIRKPRRTGSTSTSSARTSG